MIRNVCFGVWAYIGAFLIFIYFLAAFSSKGIYWRIDGVEHRIQIGPAQTATSQE